MAIDAQACFSGSWRATGPLQLTGMVLLQGIETVRRDNCLLVRNVVTTCLQKILMDKDEEGAKAFVRATISDLLMNRLDLSLLVVTKVTLHPIVAQHLRSFCTISSPTFCCSWLPQMMHAGWVPGSRLAFLHVFGCTQAARNLPEALSCSWVGSLLIAASAGPSQVLMHISLPQAAMHGKLVGKSSNSDVYIGSTGVDAGCR